ncbi:SgcJ/EcaC family oxidoreductase [Streptomyces sp. NBC_01754]|uniref:SgcJ/EcaC family oxidoreductase n=1 Tax=Streptomyces sp. NBC_01754 TaxID=2975930 RepID=UPI002DD82B9E|nr:SgcJ/EcaC family oxidoreductase [Streptomyces sp. NBC_01754]WSC90911.1 SgcJ/EcaC family oxidoreductase [Streptomyces sp. NBC_01754]WSC96595.1 SgcJ/EcaC family oxidoreductase [Streptomyces sp. NBC_01754]
MSTAVSTWGNASELLAAGGVEEDLSYYREFTSDDEKAVLSVAMRIQAAWAANDADAFAGLFAENGSLLMRDEQLTSREQIRDFMAAGFAGPLKGARVSGGPLLVTFLSDDAAMVITEGGIIPDGESTVSPENEIRALWVIVKGNDGTPELLSHQSSPVKG